MNANEIVPGDVFIDDRGRTAQLHGIGLQRIGERWFAWGEDKAAGDRFTAVVCYSSDDLATWRFEGDSLVAGSGELAPDRIVERPYWNMNDNKYSVAPALAGPWSAWRDIAPAGTNTFESQVSVVVPVGEGFVYVGDRWTEDDLESSPLVVLPLRITDDRVELEWRDRWSIDEVLTASVKG